MRKLLQGLVILAGVVLLPAAAFAQAGLAGNVKDASGAVLPGVTVEAASPALIEKTRSVVTDGTGQYKIENLRPGTYSVSFTLPGFNTVKREGIELTGSFVAAVNAEMKVGAVEETITVTGETPLVDIQSTARQAVLTKDVIDAIPTGRSYGALAVLLPGVNNSTRDVGGQLGGGMDSLSVHGGSTNDQRILQNGLNVMTLQTGGGNIGGMIPNQSAAQEVAIDTASASAERQTGGVAINYIQRDGGNTFKSYSFFTYGGSGLPVSNNLTSRIISGNYGGFGNPANQPGLASVNSLQKTYEVNPGFGGPIAKDKLWFYYTVRFQRATDYAAGMFTNLNAFQPTNLNAWTYAPDTTQQAFVRNGFWDDSQLRLTWQASPRNKFAGTWDQQSYCQCPDGISATVAPEAARDRRFPTQQLLHGEWFSTVTSRLLIEFVGLHRTERWGNMDLRPSDQSPMPLGPFGGSLTASPALYNQSIGVTETAAVNGNTAGMSYHGPASTWNNNFVPSYHFRGAVSYVTGAHSFKVGFNEAIGYINADNYLNTTDANGNPYPVRYAFNSTLNPNGTIKAANGLPTPTTVTVYATPYDVQNNQDHDFGLYGQDKWTMNRLTLNYGLRYDWFKSEFPDQLLPAADIFKGKIDPTTGLLFARATAQTLPGTDAVNWKDITPRFGLAYDVKGDGKTAIKVSVNKYVAGQTANGAGANLNPVSRLVNSGTRNWTDSNGNLQVDCDLTNPNAQNLTATGGDNCAAWNTASTGFGTLTPAAIANPSYLNGWNKRGYNWEFSAGVQREILPRVSLDVAYFRRLFGNFTVTDNLAFAASNYDTFSVIAPTDPRLGVASGTTISGLYDLNSATTALKLPNNNQVNLSDAYGKQIQHWNGVDFNVNARLGGGVTLRGGVSTGRTSNNNCDIVAAVPESLGNVPASYCATDTPFLTQGKVLAVYTLPKVDVQVSGTYQSIPGPALQGVFTLANATTNPATNVLLNTVGLNRTINAGATKTVNLLNEGMPIYGERTNQIDLRFAKIIKYGRTRTNVSVDIFNLLNGDTILTTNSAYESLYRPTGILQSRYVKLSAQFDF